MTTTTTSTPTSYHAPARRIQRISDREQLRTVVGEWKRYITARMFKDRAGVYHPFVLNNLVQELASTPYDTTAQRRRILHSRLRNINARTQSVVL